MLFRFAALLTYFSHFGRCAQIISYFIHFNFNVHSQVIFSVDLNALT